MVEELPKDPMDVTFGNDSGCCIFVPESTNDLNNGIFVPVYLLDLNIRLFAVYRLENGGDKKHRMGLVVAFDTHTENGRNILACNSLELSAYGVAGGKPALCKLTNYVEDWLIGYARRHRYHGVAMGSHSYNTSANFSGRKGDVVRQTLIFNTEGEALNPFYSDIFDWDSENALMKTRENACYWLDKTDE
ncbi:TPA: hypothetical protein HA265_00005 [Candidatus Woesearchaeota archaeon]|nr:hypothetical protein [Candidatus Woesearchaeota archaeon]